MAAYKLSNISTIKKDDALEALQEALVSNIDVILEANSY